MPAAESTCNTTVLEALEERPELSMLVHYLEVAGGCSYGAGQLAGQVHWRCVVDLPAHSCPPHTPAPNQLAACQLPAALSPSFTPLPGIAPLLEDASTSITLFAPTDEAWAAVPPQVDLKDVETLQQASKGGVEVIALDAVRLHSSCSLLRTLLVCA